MLEGFLSLPVPFVVADHLFFLDEDPKVTIHAVEMLPIPQLLAVLDFAFHATAES